VVVPDARDVEHDAAEAALGARLGEYDFGKWGAPAAAGATAQRGSGLIFLAPRAAASKVAFRTEGEAVFEGVAIAVLALAENMPDGNAIRPGDVLTSMSGKTIEVLNTDAEGRLVLADALWWVQQTHSPRLAVTIATLTGAVVRALGPDHAGLFTMDDALATRFIAAGDAAGEPLWRLPVTPATVKSLKSDIADVKNVTEGGSAPGASFGAAFIMEWAQPATPFVHIDIAGTAWDSVGRPTEPKGAVGFGVRLFDELVRHEEAAKARQP
jgi:leucyl aminopeptidase